ncbi:unnamed protein product [Calicophoron daubneyi]|uniref:Apoptotic enhancer 1 protein n=1 Tax=Calicophoron daubneyi TaxID=300641 RepID=A0AAV2TMV4_CALDB
MSRSRTGCVNADLGLSTPSTAGHGLRARLVASPSAPYPSDPTCSASSTAPGPLYHPVSYPAGARLRDTSGYINHSVQMPHQVLTGTQLIQGPANPVASSFNSPGSKVGLVKYGASEQPSDAHTATQPRPDKPTAPLPLRKHRTTSPPTPLLLETGHRHLQQNPSSPLSNADVIKSKNQWAPQPLLNTCQRHNHLEQRDLMYGAGDSSSNSYLSNRDSGGSSDLTTPSSPHRSPRSNKPPEITQSNTAAAGHQSTTPYHSRKSLQMVQAAVIHAPVSAAPIPSASTDTTVRRSEVSRSAYVPAQPFSEEVSCDTESGMTVSDLRSIAERQRQQLTRQAQQLQYKEERLAWLRATYDRFGTGNVAGLEKLPAPGSDLTGEQEANLHKLRGFRGQTEQTRLTNESLVKEIDNFARILSAKEKELEACRRKTEEARRILSLLASCHRCIPANSYQDLRDRNTAGTNPSSNSELESPLDLLSLTVPFSAERERKVWRDGLLEADSLDRQISLALGYSTPTGSMLSGLPGGPETTQPRRHKTSATLPASSGYSSDKADSSHGKTHPLKNERQVPLDERQLAERAVRMMASGGGTVGTSVSDESGANTSLSGGRNRISSRSSGDSGMGPSNHTSTSGFSSLLTRTSSPPTSRRSSLRMLLHAANSGAAHGLGKKAGADSPGSVTFNFPRLKTPPRYASRAVINDTYMRRICRDSVEKYKRTASEIYRANMERMAANSPNFSNQQPESKLGADEGHSSEVPLKESATVNMAGESAQSDSFIKLRESSESTPDMGGQLGSASPLESLSSSSSSSLELIGIESTQVMDHKADAIELGPVDKGSKKGTADVANDLAEPDNAGRTNQTKKSVLTDVSSQEAVVYVDDGLADDGGLNSISAVTVEPCELKSILRKSSKQSNSSSKTAEAGSDTAPSSTPSSSSVRFHPLALLLDAALEGDLDLVKKTASEVSDVSEPNDEGITALHNAVCAGRMDIADFLVRTAGADVNAGDTDGWTPLHCAASCGNVPLARLLVEHGASLHARTFSDQETPLEKCDQGDEEAECEEYLYFQQERLGSAASGRVYALFPRGLEAAGPGSPDAHIEPDELAVWPNEPLTIIDREPLGETEWMLAEKSDGTRGLIPRSHISCYPLIRVPPASLPMPIPVERPRRFEFWYDEDEESDAEATNPECTVEVSDAPERFSSPPPVVVQVSQSNPETGGVVTPSTAVVTDIKISAVYSDDPRSAPTNEPPASNSGSPNAEAGESKAAS